MRTIDRLVDFALGAHWPDIPDGARTAVRMLFGNAAALAVAAAPLPAVENAAAMLRRVGRTGWIPVLGRRDRWNPLDAAMLTGIAIHLEDFDDTHLPTVLHPAAPILPAALAAAQWKKGASTEVLRAIAVGAEVAIRVGNGTRPGHYNQGWHVTGTMGRIGAAVAAGAILGLDARQLKSAIAIATTEAAGLTAALGTMSKALHPGRAASDGLEAALLAAHGLEGGEADPLTGEGSFPVLSAPAMDAGAMVEGLGTEWELEQNAFKPYACGVVSHPVIDAAIELAAQAGPDEVQAVEVTVNPVVLDVMGVSAPTTGLESKFSAAHCFAVGFLYGAGGPHQFSDEVARRPEVAALRDRVKFNLSADVPKGAAKAALTTKAGAARHVDVRHATGSIQRPMTEAQLRRKAQGLVEPLLGDATVAFIQRAFALDAHGLEDVLAGSIRGTRK